MHNQPGFSSKDYIRLEHLEPPDSFYNVWQSIKEQDSSWDDFIYSVPGSSYEQMSLWSQVKLLEGWHFIRIIITSDKTTVGGFQILWKKRFFWRIGYISKGPVFKNPQPDLLSLISNLIKTIAKENKLSALLILPNSENALDFDPEEFLPNHLITLIEATTVINLSESVDDIKKRMPYMRRKNIKIASSSGSILREGTEKDLTLFFSLMLNTCRRQNVSPNPPSVQVLQKIWELFSPANRIKLFFLEFENKIITGCLVILYQYKFYAWKIGWSGEAVHIKPNDAIHWLMILWAKENGFKSYDFGSVDTGHALRVQKNESIPPEIRSTPSFYKLSFGGDVICFPKAGVYIKNNFFRKLYKLLILYKK